MTDRNHAIWEAHYRANSYQPKNGYFEALQATRLAMLQELPTNSHVLDLGCGSGTFLLPMLQAGYRMTGLDYSASILDELRIEAASRGIEAEQLHLIPCDAREIPLPNNSVDAVFSFAVLYSIPDIERVLAEIARVLRPGGVAFLELGNTRSLNAIEATRVGNGLECSHQSPGRMRHLLRTNNLAVQCVRAFQLFPLWGGGTQRASEILNPRLCEALATDIDGLMLDERMCSSPWLQPFAFRQLWSVQKGGVESPASKLPQLPAEPATQREQRRLAAEDVADGNIDQAVARLLACLGNNPDDPRPAFDLAGLYDGAKEQQLVRRWHRTLTASTQWPAEGAALTPAGQQAPRVSVVLPTYNAAHVLGEAVQSVLGQTFGDFELIIVDDGSTDDTWRYLSRLRDPRVRMLRQANQKLPGALNQGFQLAKGDLLTWISADNICEPTMLARLVATMDDNPDAQLAVAGFARIDQRGRVVDIIEGQDISYADFLPKNPGVAAFAYRAKTAQLIGGYEPSIEGAEDWDYWLRLLQHGPAVRVDEVLYRYREHSQSMTATIPDKVQRASEQVVTRWHARHGGLPKDAIGDDANDWFVLGSRLLTSPFAKPELAAQTLQHALQLDPGDGRSLVQLSIALARCGASAQAAQLAQQYAQAEDAGLRQLADALQRLADGDTSVQPEQLPMVPFDEPAATCRA